MEIMAIFSQTPTIYNNLNMWLCYYILGILKLSENLMAMKSISQESRERFEKRQQPPLSGATAGAVISSSPQKTLA